VLVVRDARSDSNENLSGAVIIIYDSVGRFMAEAGIHFTYEPANTSAFASSFLAAALLSE
jgi:hypothetical protein